jgi:hypothetical protein
MDGRSAWFRKIVKEVMAETVTHSPQQSKARCSVELPHSSDLHVDQMRVAGA